MKNSKYIRYTIEHRKAFLAIEKKLRGRNTLSGYLHDLDKVFLYLIFSKPTVQRIHRSHSRHHLKARTEFDRENMIIDWECARYTKKDKPMNARETLAALYPERTSEFEPILEKFGL